MKLRDIGPRLTEFLTVATRAIHMVGGDTRQMGCINKVLVFGVLGFKADAIKEVARATPG